MTTRPRQTTRNQTTAMVGVRRVGIRVTGDPGDVRAVLRGLHAELDVSEVSRSYRCDGAPDAVRIYVTAEVPR